MKVYITKYALTMGILVKEATAISPTVIQITDNPIEFYHNNDWHLEMPLALRRAEEMRLKKIASLKKQVEKLDAMSDGRFTVRTHSD